MHNAFFAEFFFFFMQNSPVPSVCRRSFVLLLVVAAVSISAQDQSLKARTKRAYKEGDIMIGVLMPMHKQSDKKNDYRQACGVIWEGYGIHRLEQFFRTVDEINARRDLLPGVTLGYDVRDSCWTIPVALEQSIDFIRNKIGTLDKQMAGSASDASATGHQSSARGDCSPQQRGKTIAALIGPGSSTISGPIQNVLQLFEIPEIDFGATAVELSDKNKHRFFSRVVPSDKQQARALVDIILRHNWTYIHAVHTEGMYGENGMEEFKAMLSKTGACIAVDKKLKSNVPPGDAQYMELLNEIRSKGKDKAKVIVCFCDGGAVQGIFNATATYRRMHPDYDGKFMVIGSDGWNVREDVVRGLEETANGGVSIKLHSPKIDDFEVYFSKLNPLSNDRNPWFQEFWEWKFNCTFDKSMLGWRKACDPTRFDQRIDPEKVDQDAKLGFVVNAVYALAHAFHNMLAAHCPRRRDLSGCPFINQTINGSMVFSYLRNVTFHSYSNDSIKFDEYMDGVGRYEIMTYRFNESLTGPHGKQGGYEYQKIGWWDSGNLWLKDLVDWPNVTDDQDRAIESVCSKPCEKGKVKKIQEGGVPCCWSCQQCQDHEYIISDSRCIPCQDGWWPDDNLTSCLPLEIKYKSLMDKDAIVCVVFALFGVLSCIFVLIIFVRHNSTPVVKASTRELTYIILAGVFLSYLTTVPLLMKPTLVSCYFTRILPGFSFSLIYGALATKTNRIARILSGSKKKIITRKPRFLSASAQVVITCLIVGTECVIITLMLILEPADSILHYPSKKEVRLKCNTSDYGLMVPFGFDMFLIAMCTLYAVRTRNMPENFNEAKFIGFCMYTTCAIWASFVPIYYNSDSRMTTMSFCISASATAGLIFLFYPKIYIMVYQPEKNTKSAFTTGDSTRSRFGSMASANDRGGGGGRDFDGQQDDDSDSPPPPEIKHRNRQSAKPSSQIEDVIAEKLVEVIMPPVNPPKMPKPKTISELMQQRRMSVASQGSAERLLAAALRHTRGSQMAVVANVPSSRGSISGSQEIISRHSDGHGTLTEQTASGDESSESSEHQTSPDRRTHSTSKSPANTPRQSTQDRGNSSDSSENGDSSGRSRRERLDSNDGNGQTDTSSISVEMVPQRLEPGVDPRLLGSGSGPVALLLPRPSPIPEEDEDDEASSHRGSNSPHVSRKSPFRASGKAQRPKSPHQTEQPPALPKKPPPPPSENGASTYVNLDTIQQRQQQRKREEESAATAPPLPPKPAKLVSSSLAPSAIAGRLIDHLYTSARSTEKAEREQREKGRSKKGSGRHHQEPIPTAAHGATAPSYVIPDGPPRPISPTEHRLVGSIKRRPEPVSQKPGTSSRVLQKLLPGGRSDKNKEKSSRFSVLSSLNVISAKNQKGFRALPRDMMTPPELNESVSSLNEETVDGSSVTNAEAAELAQMARPNALQLNDSPQSKRTKSQSEHRSVLLSPMSSTSYETRTKAGRYSDTISETESSASTVQKVPVGKAQAGMMQPQEEGSQYSINDNSSLSYDETSSTTSSASNAVAHRIAQAERHQSYLSRVIPLPKVPHPHAMAPGMMMQPHGNWRAPHQLRTAPPALPGMTPGSSELANDGLPMRAAGGASFTTSSMSSGLSQDTLADLPSIEELSVTGMRLLDDEEINAVRFKEYMNNLGVEIDLSVFQSTEV